MNRKTNIYIKFNRFIFTGLLLIILSITPFIYSQQINITTNSDKNEIVLDISFETQPYTLTDGRIKIIDYFLSQDESKPGSPTLPSKNYFVAIPPGSKIEIVVLNEDYITHKSSMPKANPNIFFSSDSVLTYRQTQLSGKYFKSEIYPGKVFEISGYTWIRDYYCAVLKVNTHRFSMLKREIYELRKAKLKLIINEEMPYLVNTSALGDFDKLLGEVILNYNEAEQFRSFNPVRTLNDTTGNWINYNNEYVKLAIADDGLYRINYSDMQTYGVDPQSINPVTFKIFLKGDELPLFVFGESDLSFDPGDYIEFWRTKNYNSAAYRNIVQQGEDYINYMDRYSDTTIVWLTWNGDNGKRIELQSTVIPGLTDTINSNLVKLHLEKNERLWFYDSVVPRVQLPFWQENKVWTWLIANSWGSNSLQFPASDIVDNSPVKIYTRLISNAADQLFTNAHRFGASLNNSAPQDTITFDYKQTVNFNSVLNSAELLEGNNVYRLFGLPNDSSRFHRAFIDWMDVEYYRQNVAINDSITVFIPDSVQQLERIIKVSNILSQPPDLLVYKIKNEPKKITAIDLNGNTLTISDTISGGDKYFIISTASVLKPIFKEKKQFVNLRDQTRSADYIIISNRVLETSSNDYLNFINSNYSLRTELVYVDDIYDEFGYGCDKPEAIKEFLKFTNQYWVEPSPSYLLLLGDANYDYKDQWSPPPAVKRKNLVPSYGMPVSDVWFTTWDTAAVNMQQMFVARIPAENNEQVYRYLDKHQKYLEREFDDFNKRYLFFSGGDANDPGQLELLKSANDFVLQNYVNTEPVGGYGTHFYKTIDPPTNFGPYTSEEIDNKIDSSSLFISYIGHSGTETWDNGITETADLKNIFDDRNPVISDFGCSTGKFAEPDINAFGELFISGSEDGQAINYLGNSSWGYVSTSVSYPKYFYEKLLLDTAQVISQAHFLAKVKLFSESGFSDANRVFNYCNVLFGDPLIEFAVPPKPNFAVYDHSFSIVGNNPLDLDDSVAIKIIINNLGSVPDDSLQINFTDNYQGNPSFEKEMKIPATLYKDVLFINVPVRDLVGEHILKIELDKNNSFDELSKQDNTAEFQYVVFSTSVRPLEVEKFYNSSRDSVKLLNPVSPVAGESSEVIFSIDDNKDFQSPDSSIVRLDTVATTVRIQNLDAGKRYWWQARLNFNGSKWSEPYSFFNEENNAGWFFNHSFKEKDTETEYVLFDSTLGGWVLKSGENFLEISSAGSDDGEFGSVKLNGQETLPNTFYWGIATALIDSITLEPSDFMYFLFWDPAPADSLINYIDSLPAGTLLAMTICADGAQALLGSTGSPVRQAIEQLGSYYVDSVAYRDSWCILGKKGAPQGSVLESFSRRFSGRAEIDTSLFVVNEEGWLKFPVVGKTAGWIDIIKSDSLPAGSDVNYYPLAIKDDNTVDTLNVLEFIDDRANISHINSKVYPRLQIAAQLFANDLKESPKINSLAINFIPPPELGTNYQVVSVSGDSVLIGEDVGLNFYVYNVGETTADSFKVMVDVINDDNSRITVFEQMLDSLAAGEKQYFEVSYNTSSGSGSKTFLINIDSDKQVAELFEDNNFYTIPFFIKPDTTTPAINITFDGYDIIDGDYISDKPLIKAELSDPSLLPITDPSSVEIYLNEELIPHDTSIISYQFSETNPKVIVEFTPDLTNGEYFLRVLGKDASGNIVDSAGVERYFLVSNEAKILYVYNYPNPFKDATSFTFKLTQIPDEIKIKIFTIAGRLVKEIKLSPSRLNYDFNKINWDGKDEDGDELANGVYLYKVIMTAGDKTEAVTQKLAIVR